MKRHLKRISAPKSWPILRKISTFVTRPSPSGHPLTHSMTLSVFMNEVVDVGTHTRNEAKKAVDNKDVMVDGKVTGDYKRAVGLMDVISIPKLKQHYRIVLTTKGKLAPVVLDEKEAKQKAVKIIRKTVIGKDNVQYTTHDGRNMLLGKDTYKVGDTLIIELPSQKVQKHLPLKTGSYVYLMGGKHVGEEGHLKNVEGEHVIYEDANKTSTLTSKKYVMVLGEKSSEVKIHE